MVDHFTNSPDPHLERAVKYRRAIDRADDELAFEDTYRSADQWLDLYSGLAEGQLDAGKNPLEEPLIASDLKYCRALDERNGM